VIYAIEIFTLITNLIIILIKIINFILSLEIDLLLLEINEFEDNWSISHDSYKSTLLIYYENKDINKKLIREIKIY
jgi:hypothetical protein